MPFEHKLLRDRISESLRQSILVGELSPGDRIVELDIARTFQSSQGPVREAIQRLSEEGLVESKRYRGTFVSPLSNDEMKEIFEVRKAVESLTVRRAASEMTEDQIKEARHLVERMHEKATSGDFYELVDLDMAFHRYVCECSAQTTLLRVWNILMIQTRRFITMSHPKYFPDLHELAATHDPLTESLEKRDPDQAERAFAQHIDLIWKRIRGPELEDRGDPVRKLT